jgi:hypothetical protein
MSRRIGDYAMLVRKSTGAVGAVKLLKVMKGEGKDKRFHQCSGPSFVPILPIQPHQRHGITGSGFTPAQNINEQARLIGRSFAKDVGSPKAKINTRVVQGTGKSIINISFKIRCIR